MSGKNIINKLKNSPLSPDNKDIFADTYAGRIHIDWDPDSNMTPMGQLAFFIDFIKTADLFTSFVEDCPLVYKSKNSPKARDILGTLLLSVLCGHNRYSYITSIRNDNVNPQLLGMKRIYSEDSVRRAFKNINQYAALNWVDYHLKKSYEELLLVPWILDVDSTVKALYGNQEMAQVGYNPRHPGRPSHTYHSYFISDIRIALSVEVQGGKSAAGSFSAPKLFSLLDDMPKSHKPYLIRGDSSYGNNKIMSKIESRKLKYLFKLRSSKNVKKLIQ